MALRGASRVCRSGTAFVDADYDYSEPACAGRRQGGLLQATPALEEIAKAPAPRDRFPRRDRPPARSRADRSSPPLHFEQRPLLHGLLVVEDLLSTAHGFQARVPFLDNEFWISPFRSRRARGTGRARARSSCARRRAGVRNSLAARFQRKQGFSPPDRTRHRGQQSDRPARGAARQPPALGCYLLCPARVEQVIEPPLPAAKADQHTADLVAALPRVAALAFSWTTVGRRVALRLGRGRARGMRVLVTGAAGLTGRALVREVGETGDHSGLRRPAPGWRRAPGAPVGGGIAAGQFLASPAGRRVPPLVQVIDVVVHLAQSSLIASFPR